MVFETQSYNYVTNELTNAMVAEPEGSILLLPKNTLKQYNTFQNSVTTQNFRTRQ